MARLTHPRIYRGASKELEDWHHLFLFKFSRCEFEYLGRIAVSQWVRWVIVIEVALARTSCLAPATEDSGAGSRGFPEILVRWGDGAHDTPAQ